MGYFRELPNLLYQSPLPNRTKSNDYVAVKNLFRRNKLRNDLQNSFTIFEKYQIAEGARPDTVAEEFYGNEELDWVVLMTANIINVRDEWPLSNKNLYEFTERKYGISNLSSIHHYETKEIRDSNNRIILPKGKIIDENFKISYYDNETIFTNDTSLLGNNSRLIDTPIVGITNMEYETIKNEKKRSIYLLRPIYLNQFLEDMREIMTYQNSSQYINSRLIATENTRVTTPPG